MLLGLAGRLLSATRCLRTGTAKQFTDKIEHQSYAQQEYDSTYYYKDKQKLEENHALQRLQLRKTDSATYQAITSESPVMPHKSSKGRQLNRKM